MEAKKQREGRRRSARLGWEPKEELGWDRVQRRRKEAIGWFGEEEAERSVDALFSNRAHSFVLFFFILFLFLFMFSFIFKSNVSCLVLFLKSNALCSVLLRAMCFEFEFYLRTMF